MSKRLSIGAAFLLGTSTLAATVLMPTLAQAQVTTSEIAGTVTTPSGAAISDATITLVNSANGFTRTVRTNDLGGFAARNLTVNGLYDVTVSAEGYQPTQVEGLALILGSSSVLNFTMSDGSIQDEIIVVAQRQVLADVAIGPSATFTQAQLEDLPAINRDLKDIIRLDPRIYVDESFNDSVQCAGASPRFNSLTVDGIRLNDNFGLNSNGYPTERIPFSYDAIEQVSVELAPFDVEYGGFTACNINAVTKGGSNTLTGGAFIDYTTESLKGDTAGGQNVSNDGFEEIRYGFNLGLPIVKDKLFLFGAYEKQEGSDLFGSNTPEGTGITQAQYDEVISIASSQYGYVSGGLPATVDNSDEKILVKADWFINDTHRLSGTYNYNDGFSISGSDTGSTRLADGNHFYERGARLHSYSGSLYSDWSDRFSTELRGSYIDLDNRQLPVAGTEFGEIQIDVARPAGGDTTIYLGADDSRHANKLNYDLFTLKAKANYQAGDHFFTFGAEYEDFSVFNLFIQEAEGEWVFDSVEDFRNGDFSDFRYENAAGTNNVDDGAADFGYSQTTFYGQDEWQITDALLLTLGLRYDVYNSGDKPQFNQNFFNQYGIRNDDNLNGKSLLQPRFGFNYEVNDTMVVRGGAGLYTGGNPNVWISNNYSNNGVTLFEYRVRGGNINDFDYGTGTPFFDVPTEGVTAVANAAGRGPVNALDPDFKLPSEWKFALGTTFELDTNSFLGDGYTVNIDALYTKTKESAVIQNLQLTQTDTAPGGRPVYAGFPFDDFLLTNPEDKGDAISLSASIAKSYDNGIDFSLAYAFTDAEDVNPMTSSVAFSNDKNYATSDPLNPGLATSNYVIPHRFTSSLTYRKDFFGDLTTTFSTLATYNKGRPYSFVYGSNSEFEGGFRNSRQLFYVPTDANDPNVDLSGIADTNAFFSFLDENGLNDFAGEIAPRNAFNDDWWFKVDMRISQEIPGFRDGDKASVFAVMENVGNFIDSDWGVLRQNGFPNTAEIVDVSYDPTTNVYSYSNFDPNSNAGSVEAGASTWEIRFGARYDF